MNELLREIQEDIQSEKLERLWQKFGRLMINISVAVVVATIVSVVWKNHTRSTAAEHTSQLAKGVERLDAGDKEGALLAWKPLGSDTAHGALAALYQAQQSAESSAYDALAKADANDKNQAFVNLARLQSSQAVDIARISRDDPFYFLLRERHGWEQLKAGKTDEALAVFSALRDDMQAPKALRIRVGSAAAYLKPEQTK